MSDALITELGWEFDRIIAGHDVIPFMSQLEPVGRLAWRVLPDDMLQILVSSEDYKPIRPGDAPTWFDVAAEDGHVSFVVYRSVADEEHYVLAPASR